jgi:hypothetical protein
MFILIYLTMSGSLNNSHSSWLYAALLRVSNIGWWCECRSMFAPETTNQCPTSALHILNRAECIYLVLSSTYTRHKL